MQTPSKNMLSVVAHALCNLDQTLSNPHYKFCCYMYNDVHDMGMKDPT